MKKQGCSFIHCHKSTFQISEPNSPLGVVSGIVSNALSNIFQILQNFKGMLDVILFIAKQPIV